MCRSQDLRAVQAPQPLNKSRSPPSPFLFVSASHGALPSTMRLLPETRATAVVRRPLDGWRASTTGTSLYTPTAACARPGRPCDADEADPARFTLIVSHVDPNADGTFRGNWIQTLILSLCQTQTRRGTSRARCAFAGSRPACMADAELPHPLMEVLRTGSLYRCSVAKRKTLRHVRYHPSNFDR